MPRKDRSPVSTPRFQGLQFAEAVLKVHLRFSNKLSVYKSINQTHSLGAIILLSCQAYSASSQCPCCPSPRRSLQANPRSTPRTCAPTQKSKALFPLHP